MRTDWRRGACGTFLATIALLLTTAGCRQQGEGPQGTTQKGDQEGRSGLSWTTDNAKAIELNARAVALIDQFDSGRKEAIKLLREAIQLAPNWIPARLNLAIALLNEQEEGLVEAEQILREILEADPNNAHARFCLGIILHHAGRGEEAVEHFRVVTEVMPEDSHAWFWLGASYRVTDPAKAEEYLRKALERNPILVPAVYMLGQVLMQQGKVEEARELLRRRNELEEAKQGLAAKIGYDDMGPLANAIGRIPDQDPRDAVQPPVYAPWDNFTVQLAEGTRWASWDDYDSDELARAVKTIRQKVGFPWATLDYDQDGDFDLFLAGVVIRDGKVGNLFLRNDGDGRFVDVTSEVHLDDATLTLAVAVADYDNDRDPDLYLCNAGPNQLFRNDADQGFTDVTDEAKVGGGNLLSTGAIFADLDLDADVDLFVVNVGTTDQAGSIANGEFPETAPALTYRNIGEPGIVAPEPKKGSADKGPVILHTAFEELSEEGPQLNEPGLAVTFSDIDNDRDIDILVLTAGGRCVVLYNERLFRFRPVPLPGIEFSPASPVMVLLVADWNEDDCKDLVISDGVEVGRWYQGDGKPPLVDFPADPLQLSWHLAVEKQPVTHARVVDFDLDGNFDIVGLSGGRPILARWDPQSTIKVHRQALPAFLDKDGNELAAAALVTADLTGNGFAELVGFVPGRGLVAVHTEGNGNNWIKLWFTGVRDYGNELRSTADGWGTRVLTHAGPLSTITEVRPMASGGAFAYEPITIGLRQRTELDSVRIRWPDNMLQAEVGLAAKKLHVISEVRRKTISCPVLFTWNGRRFEYIADFLGGGGLGYLLAPGLYNQPDPEENLKVEGHQLVPDQGRYRIAIAEPMDEVCYLDAVELIVVDHPAGTTVYPDERFAPGGEPATGQVLLFEKMLSPVAAETHRGHDVRSRLLKWDRRAVDQFHLRTVWPGYAEEHWVRMTFDVPPVDSGQRLFLVLAGWVEYAFSDTNYAAATAGVGLRMPVVELWNEAAGRWETIVPNAGVPAGSPKIMTVNLTGRIPTGGPVTLRLRTNVQVYWDAAWLGITAADPQMRIHRLRPVRAHLLYKGHLLEYSPDGHWPTEFDYHRVDPSPLVRQFGYYTRYGEVLELLEVEDDAFVIFGAGDAVEIDFDATVPGEVPAGWQRSFVVRTVGFCKSADPLTLYPMTVEPLPFRGMTNYPPKPDEQPADPERVRRLHRRYNTRYHGPTPAPPMP